MIRTYSELIQLPTFEERYEYLKLDGTVGKTTFGFERYLNQAFYHSGDWKWIRREIIARDLGRDLAHPEHEINEERIIIHHMNPIDISDIRDATEWLTNPDYLVCTRDVTHRAIHYGDASQLMVLPPERKAGDTKLW